MGFEELIENYCYPGISLRHHLGDIYGIKCILIWAGNIKGELLEYPGHRNIKSICH